jgi:hypothetical protein
VGPLRSVRKNRAELSAPAATARRRSSFVRASVCVVDRVPLWVTCPAGWLRPPGQKRQSERQARFSQPETIITVTRVFLCDRISRAPVCHSTTQRALQKLGCWWFVSRYKEITHALVNGSECISVFGVQIDLTPVKWSTIDRPLRHYRSFVEQIDRRILQFGSALFLDLGTICYRQVRCVITGRWHCCRFYWTCDALWRHFKFEDFGTAMLFKRHIF